MSVNLPNVQQPFVDQATGLVNRTWYLALLALNNQVVPDVVTSVNIAGFNGIQATGGPITSAGTFSLRIGNLTCANIAITGTITAANAVISGTVTAANVATGGMIATGTVTAANIVVTGLIRAPRKASVLLTYINAAWTIFAPDGSLVSTAGTTTDGLQEAINYAQTNGYSLEVWGPGVTAAGTQPARINCTSGVTMGPAAYMDFILKGCIVGWDTFDGDCLTIDTLDNCTVDIDCVLRRSGGVAGDSLVVFAPTTDEPQFGGNHMQQNKIFIRHCLQYNTGAPTSLVQFAPQVDRAIINNIITFCGLDGGTYSDNCLQADNPILGGSNLSAFNDNRVTFGLAVNFISRALSIGAAGLNPATQPLAANTWAGSIESTAAAGVDGILTHGFFDTFLISSIDINSGTLTNGINFAGTSATDNFVICPQIVATTNQVVDAGARNTVFHDAGFAMVSMTVTNAIVTGTITAANVVATATVSAVNITSSGTVSAANVVITGSVSFAAPVTAFLGANRSVTNNAAFFDAVNVTASATGTWYVSASTTYFSNAGGSSLFYKLWDGTTVIASQVIGADASGIGSSTLAGVIVNPAAALRMSIRDTVTTGTVIFNSSGTGRDTSIMAQRIA